MPTYYYEKNNQLSGPHSIKELRRKNLSPDTRIRSSGEGEWHTMAYYLRKSGKGHKRSLVWIIILISLVNLIGFVGAFLFDKYKFDPADAKMLAFPMDKEGIRLSPYEIEGVEVRKRLQSKGREEILGIEKLEKMPADLFVANPAPEMLNVSRIEARKKLIRNNFQDFISTKKSSFIIDPSWGVRDIFIVAENRSEFVIDAVHINVQVINPDFGVIQTYPVTFEAIGPYQQRSIQLSDVEEAESLDIIITEIRSRALDFCFSVRKLANNEADPYKCN